MSENSYDLLRSDIHVCDIQWDYLENMDTETAFFDFLNKISDIIDIYAPFKDGNNTTYIYICLFVLKCKYRWYMLKQDKRVISV